MKKGHRTLRYTGRRRKTFSGGRPSSDAPAECPTGKGVGAGAAELEHRSPSRIMRWVTLSVVSLGAVSFLACGFLGPSEVHLIPPGTVGDVFILPG